LFVEKALAKALGGQQAGILAVQLVTDANGRVSVNGPCKVWVGDIARNDRRLSKALVAKLKGGTAALITERFAKIQCRGNVALAPVCEPSAAASTEARVADTIYTALQRPDHTALVLSRQLSNGEPLPFDDAGSPDIPLSELGDSLGEASDLRDVRCLFPSTGARTDPIPTVNMLCAALSKLSSDGYVRMYNNTVRGRHVLVVRAAVGDDWNAAAHAMLTD